MDAQTIGKNLIGMFLIIVCCFPYEILTDVGKSKQQASSQNVIKPILPIFFTKNNTKVIAQIGGSAILPCVIKMSARETISWIRRKDYQLLTVGLDSHSRDSRFLVEHSRHFGHWSLRIKSVREDDEGLYECQLSVYPTQSIFIELNVIEAYAEIVGAPDLHINEGSALRIECKLNNATEVPLFIFWYHYNKVVNHDLQDGYSVSTINESLQITNTHRHRENNSRHRSKNRNRRNSTVDRLDLEQHNCTNDKSNILRSLSISILTIDKVNFNHAGNYTCVPSNTKPASANIHVLRGEKPAAMQYANRSLIIEEIGKSKATTIRWLQQKHEMKQHKFIETISVHILKLTLLELILIWNNKINR